MEEKYFSDSHYFAMLGVEWSIPICGVETVKGPLNTLEENKIIMIVENFIQDRLVEDKT
jgi:hypothetical protein